MKVGIIGCGPAGLSGIKQCIAEGFEVIAFDKSQEIGGEWNSTLQVGTDKYGVDIHSKIYENLTTNLPKVLMAFSNFLHTDANGKSFQTPEKVLQYLQAYADAFDLRQHIKLEHHVISARPLSNSNRSDTSKWEVIAKDLRMNEHKTFIFDVLFICIGLSTAWLPQIEGQNYFKGRVIHSRDYRNTSMFENENVLLIGSGLSAIDMMLDIGKVARKVVWIHRIAETYGKALNFELPSSVILKSALKQITRTGAEFCDGSSENFTIIAYATGYDFTFPFLSVDSNISISDKCVYPLYKQCLNANRPTLAIIGLPFFALAFPMFELQIKFCLQFWTGRRQLPSRDEMLTEIDDDFRARNIHKNKHEAHFLGLDKHEAYYNEIADTAGIAAMKPVFVKMFNHNFTHAFDNFLTFRHFNYKILNENEFTCDCCNQIFGKEECK